MFFFNYMHSLFLIIYMLFFKLYIYIHIYLKKICQVQVQETTEATAAVRDAELEMQAVILERKELEGQVCERVIEGRVCGEFAVP